MSRTCWSVCHSVCTVSFSAQRCLHSAVVAAGGMIGYAGGAATGGVYSVLLRARKVAGSCNSPRCPLLTPQVHGAAMRFAPSSFSSLHMAVCVGSP